MSTMRSLWLASVLWMLLIVSVCAIAIEAAVTAHRQAGDALATHEPRYRRLLGVAAGRDRIAAAASDAARGLQRHAYEATREPSQAANDAQQRVRDLFSKAGLDVLTIQALPVRQSTHFDRLPVSLRVEGELQALQAALATLPAASPSVLVESFALQSATASETAPIRVAAELQLLVLRSRP